MVVGGGKIGKMPVRQNDQRAGIFLPAATPPSRNSAPLCLKFYKKNNRCCFFVGGMNFFFAKLISTLKLHERISQWRKTSGIMASNESTTAVSAQEPTKKKKKGFRIAGLKINALRKFAKMLGLGGKGKKVKAIASASFILMTISLGLAARIDRKDRRIQCGLGANGRHDRS